MNRYIYLIMTLSLFSINLKSQSITLEKIINYQFNDLNDSVLMYSFASNNLIKLKFKEEKIFSQKIFSYIPYSENNFDKESTGTIYFTYYDTNCIAGHLNLRFFHNSFDNGFFIYSQKYNFFILFNFIISFVETDESGKLITNQHRKNRFTMIGASPFEAYIYKANFTPIMKMVFGDSFYQNNKLEKHFYCIKTHYTTKESKSCQNNLVFNKIEPIYNMPVIDFFNWLNLELLNVQSAERINCKNEPHNFFYSK